MKTYTTDELKTILDLHRKWWIGEEGGVRANLTHANLTHANLTDAYLAHADLTDANLTDETTIDTGETWRVYLDETVPQLLLAGERGVEAVRHWDNHSWSDCPMHIAFSIANENEAPALLRPRIRQFVQFFDAGLIPQPQIGEAPVNG